MAAWTAAMTAACLAAPLVVHLAELTVDAKVVQLAVSKVACLGQMLVGSLVVQTVAGKAGL